MTTKTTKILVRFLFVTSLLGHMTLKAQNNKSNANDMMRVNINQDTSDEIFPRFWGDGVAFASNRGNTSKTKDDFDLYIMNDTADNDAKKLKGKFKSRYNETSPFVSKDGNTLYFSRNDLDLNFARRKRIEKRPLKTFSMQKKGNRWTKMRELPFNSNEYSVAHVVLNDSEDKMYFVSNMPGGYGGMDLYEVDINEDGSYGEPKNLGGTINTEFDETSPFLADDNLLFFASEGHESMGGLDIFKTDLDSDVVENLGQNINTIFDDYGFILDLEKGHAFFSSNRGQAVGSTNIFFTKYNIEEEKNPVEEKQEEEILAHTEDENNSDSKESDSQKQIELISQAQNLDEEFAKLEKIVYFEFDSKLVQFQFEGPLNEMAAFLIKHNHIKIVLVGHTDAIGNENYNQNLSLDRANSIKEYLITQGIQSNRMSIVGKGESEPAEDCEDCPKYKYNRNRRVEVKLNDE